MPIFTYSKGAGQNKSENLRKKCAKRAPVLEWETGAYEPVIIRATLFFPNILLHYKSNPVFSKYFITVFIAGLDLLMYSFFIFSKGAGHENSVFGIDLIFGKRNVVKPPKIQNVEYAMTH